MVEITCPFCEQTHTRSDLHVLSGSPDKVEPDDLWTEEEIQEWMASFNQYECGAQLADDGTCSREVSGPDERCFQHE